MREDTERIAAKLADLIAEAASRGQSIVEYRDEDTALTIIAYIPVLAGPLNPPSTNTGNNEPSRDVADNVDKPAGWEEEKIVELIGSGGGSVGVLWLASQARNVGVDAGKVQEAVDDMVARGVAVTDGLTITLVRRGWEEWSI